MLPRRAPRETRGHGEGKASPFSATVLAVLSPLLEPLGVAALVAVLVIFMLLKYEDLRNRLIGLVGSGQLDRDHQSTGGCWPAH